MEEDREDQYSFRLVLDITLTPNFDGEVLATLLDWLEGHKDQTIKLGFGEGFTIDEINAECVDGS